MPGEAFWRNRVAAYGKSVWFWHPLLVSSWRRRVDPTGFRQSFNPSATVTRRIRRRGERAISRKTIAQGMSECSVCTCMLVCVSLHNFAHETVGAASTRHSLHPLVLGRVKIDAKLGRIAPRDREATSGVQCAV